MGVTWPLQQPTKRPGSPAVEGQTVCILQLLKSQSSRDAGMLSQGIFVCTTQGLVNKTWDLKIWDLNILMDACEDVNSAKPSGFAEVVYPPWKEQALSLWWKMLPRPLLHKTAAAPSPTPAQPPTSFPGSRLITGVKSQHNLVDVRGLVRERGTIHLLQELASMYHQKLGECPCIWILRMLSQEGIKYKPGKPRINWFQGTFLRPWV